MKDRSTPNLSPPKGRWPKGKAKQSHRRYRLEAAGEYKKALNRHRYGTLGAASKVRHIDLTGSEPVEV
jgi:hypothetical protein